VKKRLIALLLCAGLLTGLLTGTAGAADSSPCFISINDTLPPELINVAVSYGSDLYVPYSVFTGYSLGLSYSFFLGNSTAYLHDAERQIFFELATGLTYDEDDFRYSTPAIFQGGTVYLPLYFMCSYFGGLRCASLSSEYGTVLRITNGSEVLTDEEFLKAAKSAMKRYASAYTKPTESPAVTTPPVSSPLPTAEVIEVLPHEGDTIHLGLVGLPSAGILRLLERMKMSAAFFLTAEEALSAPDTVREILCAGFGLGLSCPGGTAEEYTEGTALLWELTRSPVLLALAPEENTLPSEAVQWVLPDGTPENRISEVYAATGVLEFAEGSSALIFPGGESDLPALRLLLDYLQDEGFTVTDLRETDGRCPQLFS